MHNLSPAEIENTKFSTKPLLGASQTETLKGEIQTMEAMAANPVVQNKPQVLKQLAQLQHNYNTQAPKTPVPGSKEEAVMVARSKYLLDKIVPTMCSQEEMRKCPPGAVDKFQKGENGKEIKPLIAEWQNLQKRLHPGDRDAANLERFRPKDSTLNMDNAVIPGKVFFMPQHTTGNTVTFSDEQIALLRLIDPATADKLATMPNDLRGQIQDLLIKSQSAPAVLPSEATPGQKPKRQLSAKQKKVLADGRKKKAAKQKKAKVTKKV